MDVISTNKAKKLRFRNQLVERHEWTTQLQQLLLLSQPWSGLAQANDLVAKILGSSTNSISDFDSFELISSSSLAAVEGSENASCDNDGKFEDSGDSRKRLGPVKGKRGCYKRKKRSETWIIESSVPEDEFSWRKYGQKMILNANFPRSYFRCTHKYTQGCKATKQVQKVELEPKMFNITYIGNHTCNTNGETPKIKTCDHHDEIIMDSEELKSPSLTISMKEEEENHHHHDHHHGSSTEKDLSSLVWTDIVFEDDHHHYHHHEAIYGCGGTSASINALCSTDLMVFGEAVSDFGFSDNDHQLSIFDSCSNL